MTMLDLGERTGIYGYDSIPFNSIKKNDIHHHSNYILINTINLMI